MIRVLYVPNERGDFRQVGFRRPLLDLRSAHLVDTKVFSLQWRVHNGGDAETHRRDLVRLVGEFRPEIVLMQHIAFTGMSRKHFEDMRAASNFKLVYHEADPYGRWMHRLPPPVRAVAPFSDVVFTVGSGVFADNFRRAGAKDVRWSSHVFEPERFGIDPLNTALSRPFDIVVVANRNTPRFGFRGLPNWRDRIAFVEYLQRRFGSRLAVFGRGWEGVGVQGPVGFASQGRAIASGWISANWDHYASEPRYYSNRLPISLASGSIHATTHHPGVEELFGDRPFLRFGKSHQVLGDEIEALLDRTTPKERIELGALARAYAFDHFRQDDQLVELLNFEREVVDPRLAKAAWSTGDVGLTEL